VTLPDVLSILSGALVGTVLGVIGGGGSILAVPLLLYVVGLTDPHVAIGTAALAVSLNAFANLIPHARAGTIKWPCALVFAATGMVGALAGSSLGKLVDGQKLLLAFALAMIAVGVAMLRRKGADGDPGVHIDRTIATRLVGLGLGAGTLAGFFGIGGGFLIVPGLVAGSGMAMLNAIGSSLVGVGVLGLTTAVNYAASGLIDWRVAAFFLTGGIVGGWFGMMLALRLATRRALLTRLFAGALFIVAVVMIFRTATALGLL